MKAQKESLRLQSLYEHKYYQTSRPVYYRHRVHWIILVKIKLTAIPRFVIHGRSLPGGEDWGEQVICTRIASVKKRWSRHRLLTHTGSGKTRPFQVRLFSCDLAVSATFLCAQLCDNLPGSSRDSLLNRVVLRELSMQHLSEGRLCGEDIKSMLDLSLSKPSRCPRRFACSSYSAGDVLANINLSLVIYSSLYPIFIDQIGSGINSLCFFCWSETWMHTARVIPRVFMCINDKLEYRNTKRYPHPWVGRPPLELVKDSYKLLSCSSQQSCQPQSNPNFISILQEKFYSLQQKIDFSGLSLRTQAGKFGTLNTCNLFTINETRATSFVSFDRCHGSVRKYSNNLKSFDPF